MFVTSWLIPVRACAGMAMHPPPGVPVSSQVHGKFSAGGMQVPGFPC